jgi:hypothetical protein
MEAANSPLVTTSFLHVLLLVTFAVIACFTLIWSHSEQRRRIETYDMHYKKLLFDAAQYVMHSKRVDVAAHQSYAWICQAVQILETLGTAMSMTELEHVTGWPVLAMYDEYVALREQWRVQLENGGKPHAPNDQQDDQRCDIPT